MYEQFGAALDGSKVEFKLFVPDNTIDPTQYTRGGQPGIKTVRVVGDFLSVIGGQDWDVATAPTMAEVSHPNGRLYQFKMPNDLPDGFYEYKYFVEFTDGTTRFVSDPCAKYGGRDQINENSAFVIGGSLAQARPIASRLAPKDLIIYEMMMDDFTANLRTDDPGNTAPVDVVKSRIPYLKQLGINAVEFMPWTPWAGGSFSWGYNPNNFFAVEYRYIHDPSTPFDKLHKLRELINALHDADIQVIMDGVFNHVEAGIDPSRGFPYRWLYQHPNESPFIGAFAGGGFFEEFDYTNKCVQEFIRDICLYWFDAFQIDGIRFDFTLGFFRQGEPHLGITKLIADIKAHMSDTGRTNIALILEHLTDNRFESIEDTNEAGASNNWLDPYMFEHFGYARNGNIGDQLLRVLNSNRDYAAGKGPVIYVQNHDHSTYMHEAGGRHRWFKTQPGAIALMTCAGAVMIHNGQEFGEDKSLPGSGDGRVVPRPLRWGTDSPESGDFVGGRLFDVYAHLINIRKQHPGLHSPNFFPDLFNHPDGYGAFPDKDIVIYHRWGTAMDGSTERFIVVINYSDIDQWITVPFPADGQWDDLLNGGFATVNGFRLFDQRISSNWGRIYLHRG
jgi:pullulanase